MRLNPIEWALAALLLFCVVFGLLIAIFYLAGWR